MTRHCGEPSTGLDCYVEMLYRTITTKGVALTTFTPLHGMSELVKTFLEVSAEARRSKTVIQVGWAGVPHLDESEQASLLAATPPFQRDARTKGTPQLGAGAIYQVPETELVVSPFEIPSHWLRCWGADTT